MSIIARFRTFLLNFLFLNFSLNYFLIINGIVIVFLFLNFSLNFIFWLLMVFDFWKKNIFRFSLFFRTDIFRDIVKGNNFGKLFQFKKKFFKKTLTSKFCTKKNSSEKFPPKKNSRQKKIKTGSHFSV